MMKADLKYLLAYIVPLSAIVGIYNGGLFSYSTIGIVFILVPILESLLPGDASNLGPNEVSSKKKSEFFDLILYLNLPLIALLIAVLYIRIKSGIPTWELPGIIGSAGITMGASGINVAHELGHKPEPLKRFISSCLLVPGLYTHFRLEHNYGHHKYVATPLDPATAKKGENIYVFWVKSIILCYRNAWRIELRHLKQKGKKVLSWQNTFLRGQLVQIVYLSIIYLLLGFKGLVILSLCALVAVLLLETINYIEHYGLMRRKLPNGRYEPVGPEHSWNSNHEIGRILLYELTRHSDHHFIANKKYQLLDHHDSAKQLPHGYPTSMLISFLPFLWFSIMNKKLA